MSSAYWFSRDERNVSSAYWFSRDERGFATSTSRNHRIRIFDVAHGAVSTLAGTGEVGMDDRAVR